ncbi:MAG: dUTP diphosphatase [Bacteroidota bacterium]
MKVKIVNQSNHSLPRYSTEQSSGMDLQANIEEPVKLKPLERSLIPTGMYIELPTGYEAQIRPRSGLTLKKGITILNTPGTIDSDYRGEIGVITINLSNETVEITPGERICQLVVSKVEKIELEETGQINETSRSDGGFGHTGTH